MRFAHPQQPLRIAARRARPLASRFVQVRVGGDVALLKGVMKELLALEEERPGAGARPRLPRDAHRPASRRFRAALDAAPLRDALVAESGVAARRDRASWPSSTPARERIIACWAMGLTQHRNARRQRPGDRQPAAAAREHRPAGRRRLPGARSQQRAGRPHHGHLRAPGRRVPRPPRRASSRFEPPRAAGLDTVEAIARDGARRGRRSSSRSAATSSRPTPDTARHRGRARRAAPSPCTSRPS